MARDELATRSFWLGEALGADDSRAPALEGEIRADVCIVGGGFTGLWTAIRLKQAEPSLDVVIVEKDVCGAGASGRNGGFVLSWWAKLLTLAKIAGDEDAIRLAELSAANVAEIGAFARNQEIACGFRHDGWLWSATGPVQLGSWRDTMAAAERFQRRPFADWTSEEVARRSGSARHIAGVFEASAASVQPAALARGLRRVALDLGVRIHEGSPMTRLVRSAPARIVTPRGGVTAAKVVLAMNAWAIRLAEIRKGIIVVSSDVVGTAPAPETLARLGWNDGMCISDGRALVHYYRTTPDGRVVFGKGGLNGTLPFGGRVGAMFDGPSSLGADVEGWLRWTYPGLAGVAVAQTWTGPIDRSRSGLPFFHHLEGRPDILFGVGFSGNGVGPCAIGGRILASLALDRDDEWSRCALVRPLGRDFPPEPVRFVGGHMVRRAMAAKDRAEDAGRRPSALVRCLASFAPAGLSPVKGQKASQAKAPAA